MKRLLIMFLLCFTFVSQSAFAYNKLIGVWQSEDEAIKWELATDNTGKIIQKNDESVSTTYVAWETYGGRLYYTMERTKIDMGGNEVEVPIYSADPFSLGYLLNENKLILDGAIFTKK